LRHFFADKAFAASRGDAHGAKLAMRHKHIATSGGYVDHTNSEKLKAVIEGIEYSGAIEKQEILESTQEVAPVDKSGEITNQDTDKKEDTSNASDKSNISALKIYIVKGQMIPAPADKCPSCQGEWGDKIHNPKCGGCGLILRKDLKIQAMDGKCLFCSDGKIEIEDRVCESCGNFHDDGLAILTGEELSRSLA
jgi:hypothetical protein